MSHKIRLLLVDDNEVNLDVLARRLERKDCEVVTATNGRSALEALEREPFDTVILDVRMPEMTGHEVLEAIRARRSQIELPVIMATAETDPDEVVRALEGGANDYVTKPIDVNVLLARIRAQLRSRNSTPPPAPKSPKARAGIGVGDFIAGRYRLEALLGSGGFGNVYRARHLRLHSDVAVKVLHPHLLTATAVRRRFEQEAISTCRVRHPHAVQVLDAGTTDDGLPYLAMELLVGRSLGDILQSERQMRLARVVELLRPVCLVLEEAHRVGMVHRDVKPANIMVTSYAGEEMVKVLDFGIATFIDREKKLGLTGDGVVGTPLFMSPEALLGGQTGPASDVFSVGVTAYLMLAGNPPHGPAVANPFEQAIRQVQNAPTPLSTSRPDLPSEVAHIVMATLSRDPVGRPTLSKLRETLTRWSNVFIEPEWPPSALADAPTVRAPVADAPTVHLGDLPSLQFADASGASPVEGGNTAVDESGERQSVPDVDAPPKRRDQA